MARNELDFSVDLEMLPETDFSPFEQCLFLLNNLEGVSASRKNALKSALIMADVREPELKTIVEVFLDTKEPDFFISSIERLTNPLARAQEPSRYLPSPPPDSLPDETVSSSPSRLLDSPPTEDSFLMDMDAFSRPAHKPLESSVLGDSKLQSLEQTTALPLQSHASKRSSQPMSRNALPLARNRVLNTTQHIRNTHTKIEDAVANFRALLGGKPPAQNSTYSANVTMDHLKSPFKKDFHSFLGEELLSPIQPSRPERCTTLESEESARAPAPDTLAPPSPPPQALLSPLKQKCNTFNQKTLGLVTGLRYVKTEDLLFLLEDYTPDQTITRASFESIVSLLRESVVGSDAPLPHEMFEQAVADLWGIIRIAQKEYGPTEEDEASVVVVGPALVVLTKGEMESKIAAVIQLVTKGAAEATEAQLAQGLAEIFELIFKFENVPKVIRDKASTNELARFSAATLVEQTSHTVIGARAVERWLAGEELDETLTEVDQSEVLSQQSSVVCGVTFRDSLTFKSFGEKKKPEKPEVVPKLDLSNTQGIKTLKEKCERVLANAEKLQVKVSRRQSRELTQVPSSQPSEIALTIPEETEEALRSRRSQTKQSSRISTRPSQSLVPLPSHRAKTLISPKRREIPAAVKRFTKLRVFELDSPGRMVNSFKLSPQREESKHYKTSSMFVPNISVAAPPTVPLREDENRCSEIKLSIATSPPREQATERQCPLVPKTTMNQSLVKQEDEVRFSTESWVSKTPQGMRKKGGVVALNESAVATRYPLLMKENAANSSFSSVNASLATFAAPLGSPEKRRNIKIAVLDYFLKH